MLRENVICFFYLKMFIRMRKKKIRQRHTISHKYSNNSIENLCECMCENCIHFIYYIHTLQWNNICTLNKVISGNLIWNKLKNGARFLSTKSNKTNSLYFQYMIWFGGSTQHSHCFFELFYAVYWKVVVV